MISRGKYACYCNILLLSRFLQHHFVPVFLIPGNSYNILKQFFFFFFFIYFMPSVVFFRTIWDHKSTKCHLHKEFCSYSILPLTHPHPPVGRPRTPRPVRTPWHWPVPVLWCVSGSSTAALAPVCPRRSGSVAETCTYRLSLTLKLWFRLSSSLDGCSQQYKTYQHGCCLVYIQNYIKLIYFAQIRPYEAPWEKKIIQASIWYIHEHISFKCFVYIL